jgi:hypothetical protein
MGMVCIALVPWLAYLAPGPRDQNAVEKLWFGFRDRFGFVWGERLREQFNRSMSHAGCPLHLRWRGLVGQTNPETGAKAVETLRALMKRFVDQ